MKITSVTQQHNRKDRFSIHIDGEYRFSLSQNQLTDFGLRTGDELSQDRLDELIQYSELGKALDKAYRFLSLRPRSKREMATYLKSKQYDSAVSDGVIARLEAQSLLDDYVFGCEWVADRQLFNPRSHLELKVELRQKGLSTETIDEVLAALPDNDEVAALTTLMAKKNLRHRYADERKLHNYLSTKGYSQETIRSVLELG